MKTSPAFLAAFLASNVVLSQPRLELGLSHLVSQERLKQTVRDLVEFGNRQGGTLSGDNAAAYVLQKFRKLELRAELLDDPEKPTFVNERWTLDVVSPRQLRGTLSHSWLAGFSPSANRTRTKLVQLPPDGDLSDIDIDSAAVLVDLENSNRLYEKLSERGAVCLLTWADANSKAYENSAFIENLPASERNPIPVFDISRSSARLLAKRLGSGKPVTIEFSSKTHIKTGTSKTVVATLPGKSKKYFVICAHGDSDSGGPGADDNASGEAGVMELARCLITLRRDSALPIPDSTIKFIIWGSEYGSAENYVKSHSKELQNILGILNFDEIGTGASRNCIYFEGNDQRINYHLLKTLQKVGEDYVGKKSFWHEATTNPSQGGTDSYVFLPNYLGRLGVPIVEIPSVTVYTAAWQEPKCLFQPKDWRTSAWKGPKDSVCIDYSLYYHSSMDTPEMTTDREPFDMVWGVKAVGIALLRLAWH